MNASLTLSGPEVPGLLDQPFIIIAGSAVSGVAPPWLPMVAPVKNAMLGRIAGQAAAVDPDLARLARQLCPGGSHHDLLQNTKFEEFMFFAFARLCEGRHRDALDDLGARLFQCPPSLYGVNHSAIAYLVEHGHALACLTTNFDNALENAWPHWIVEHERVPDELRQGHLVKLHGDAAKRTTVCTSRDLIAVGKSRGMRNIRNLLDGRRVLVVGYSGHGDTDIAPELRAAQGAEFIWAVRDASKGPRTPRDEAPDFATWQFETNLSASSEANVLWALAASRGWQGCPSPSVEHDWKPRLEEWCEAHSEHHTKFVSAFYEWRGAEAARELDLRSGRTLFDAAQQQAQEGRYWSAMRTLEAAGAETLDATDDDPTRIHMRASAEVRAILGDTSASSDLETLAMTTRDSTNYRSAFAAVRALMPRAPDLARSLFDSIDAAQRNGGPRRSAMERRLLLWLSNPENPTIGRRFLRPLPFQLRCAKSEIRHRFRF
jgi:hypothetical protein